MLSAKNTRHASATAYCYIPRTTRKTSRPFAYPYILLHSCKKRLKHLWKSVCFGKINLWKSAYFPGKHLGITANWITYITINQNIKFPNTKIQPPKPVVAGKLLRPYHPKRNRIPEHFRIHCKQSHKMGRRYVKNIANYQIHK